MLSKIQFGIMLIFLSIFSFYVYTAHDYKAKNVRLTETVLELKRDLKACEDAALRVQASCLINDRIISESSEKKTEMLNKAATILSKVNKLPLDSLVGGATNVEKPVSTGDASSVDAELKRLLDDAYCTATASSDPYCSSR